ncbi:hypothetical protein ALO61_101128 [Pseudomonas savastanoi pv. nerii]|nr:hypothetical protein AC519_2262 [Pseudomonas savastanoi]KPW67739.1 hypothetical protein ALO78_101037 [Pseudomonas amygdali pv. ciccaronei]KPY06427.1 hypothetical protein ALO61_101128 [Pseudomonas savastanoi pv. nerii]KPY50087.1 hypothetical protein ALO49_101161 [Pseudomonas savastanoi pv. retacarpa]KPY76135.1 hypothetical protein ALO58_101083 [Pseudomonas savastanoi pv. savastanoi]RMR68277.1 hypothetical protein ALP82_101203 [Pseudomonas savastanoi pv. fraxini]
MAGAVVFSPGHHSLRSCRGNPVDCLTSTMAATNTPRH